MSTGRLPCRRSFTRWLLIRPSGTEPVLRIYAEGRSEEQVRVLLGEGGALAEAQIGQLAAA